MGELYGIAAPFFRRGDRRTEYLLPSGEWERFAPGAFDRTLQHRRSIRCDLLHNGEIHLGSTGEGNVRLWVDDVGLQFVVDLARCAYARTVRDLVEYGGVCGASVSFVSRDARTFRVGSRIIVKHLDVDLIAFSPVQYPAYRATTVALRRVGVAAEQRALSIG